MSAPAVGSDEGYPTAMILEESAREAPKGILDELSVGPGKMV